MAALMGFEKQADHLLAGGQTLLGLGPTGHDPFLQLARAGPIASFQPKIPNVPALCGITMTIQAVHFGGGQLFALSNAYDLSVAGF